MNEKFSISEANIPKVIKHNSQTIAGSSSKLIKHQIISARAEAGEIVKKARTNAAQIIADAEEKSEELRSEAYNSGRELAESEIAENLLETSEIRSRALSDVERDILSLAVKLAEKIIGREVEQNEFIRVEIVQNALRAAHQQENLSVRVSKADLPELEERYKEDNSHERLQYINFVADQAVRQGGCIIESQSGTIDARLETQLRILENALLTRSSSKENPNK